MDHRGSLFYGRSGFDGCDVFLFMSLFCVFCYCCCCSTSFIRFIRFLELRFLSSLLSPLSSLFSFFSFLHLYDPLYMFHFSLEQKEDNKDSKRRTKDASYYFFLPVISLLSFRFCFSFLLSCRPSFYFVAKRFKSRKVTFSFRRAREREM